MGPKGCADILTDMSLYVIKKRKNRRNYKGQTKREDLLCLE